VLLNITVIFGSTNYGVILVQLTNKIYLFKHPMSYDSGTCKLLEKAL